jgi:radical SAM protein with 4Fe4S-binding SPASM domain
MTEYKKKNKIKTTIGIQFLLIDDNEKEAEEIAKICKDLGVDYLSIKPYSHHPKSLNNFEIDYKKCSELKKNIMKYASEDYKILYRSNAMDYLEYNKDYCNCNGLDFFSLIDAEGNVIPCNLFFTGNDENSYGNINNQSFEEIWTGEKRKQINEKINKNLKEKCRLGCRLDSINKYLHRLLYPCEHDNFI